MKTYCTIIICTYCSLMFCIRLQAILNFCGRSHIQNQEKSKDKQLQKCISLVLSILSLVFFCEVFLHQ